MTALADKLISMNLADRASDKADRRVTNIKLTPKGRRVLKVARDQVRQQINERLSVDNHRKSGVARNTMVNTATATSHGSTNSLRSSCAGSGDEPASAVIPCCAPFIRAGISA